MTIGETQYCLHVDIHRHYKIVLIADLHNVPVQGILDKISTYHPDLIVIAGDLVYGTLFDRDGYEFNPQQSMLEYFPNAEKLIEKISSVAPTFFSYGNHEWLLTKVDIERIQAAGIIILDNEWIKLHDGLLIAGLSSPDVSKYWKFQEQYRLEHPGTIKGRLKTEYYYSAPYSERKTPEYKWLNEFEKQEGYKILICHHPEHWALREPMLVNRKVDLVLSGHAHGGQIRIGNQGIYASDQGFLPKYTSGIHEGNYGKMIISRGLSNPTCVPRLFNPPELVYIEIKPMEILKRVLT